MTKTKTRLLAVGLTLLALIAAMLVIPRVWTRAGAADIWDGKTKTEFAGSGTKDDPFEISNGAEFAHFVDQVNSGHTYKDEYIELSDDIYLGNNSLPPIGSESAPFEGTFDGNGKSVKNLKVVSDKYYLALFRYNSGTISSLYLDEVWIETYNNIAGICVYNNGTIDGCGVNSGTLKISGDNGSNVGGIAAFNSGTISRCFNNANIIGGGNIAGIVVTNEKGGLVENCYNTGTISGAYTVASGLFDGNNGTVRNCFNAGEVSNSGGTAYGLFNTLYIVSTTENCYNVSDVFNGKLHSNYYVSNTTIVSSVENITMADLCSTLPNDFEPSVWTPGSVGSIIEQDEQDDRFANREYSYPSLTGVGAASAKVPVYNFSTGSDDDWDTYELISSADEFIAIGNDVDKLAGNYVLANDISFKGKGVFRVAVDQYFTGKFSGNGHEMTDISMSGGYSQLAPFGKNSGLIMDLSVSGDISQKKGYGKAGGICASNRGTIANCMFVGSISSSEIAGGICGEIDGGYVKDCVVVADISADDYVGAICGNSGTEPDNITNCYYDKDMCSVKGLGSTDGNGTTGLTREDLCGSTPNLSSAHWKEGKIGTDNNNYVLIMTYSYPRLNNATAAHTAVKALCDYSLEGNGSGFEDCIVINTTEDFIALTNDKTAWDKNYALGADIKLKGTTITSIGTDMNYPFTGKFSGNAYTIFDVTINSPDTEFVGIFGVNRGHIMDINATGTVTGKNFVGGICGLNDTNCVINNCEFNDGEVTGKEHVGGICGQNNGKMNSCRSGSNVNGSSNVGGVCGYNIGSLTGGYAYSLKTISGSNSVGGVCGYNSGSISRSSSESKVSGDYGVGGVCGYVASNGTVSDSFNVGKISGGGTVGGVCGYNYGSISTCYSAGTVTGDSYIGGVCGMNSNSSTITDCYYDKQFCTANNSLGTGLTHSGFCNGSLLTGFSSTVWGKGDMAPLTENGKFRKVRFYYPVLLDTYNSMYVIDAQQYNFSDDSTADWQDFTLVTTPEQFAAIGKDSGKWTDNFVLGSDIDLTGTELKCIGDDNVPFTGNFSGDGYALQNVNAGDSLFWRNDGLIEDLIVESGTISGANMNSSICHFNNGKILRCGNGASVESTAEDSAGGIVVENTGTISNCFNVGSVTAPNNAGGICVTNSGTIENCYNAGKLKINESGNLNYVCVNYGGKITNCWGIDAAPSSNTIDLIDLLYSTGIEDMSFDTNVWTKLPTDKEKLIAYYPSTSSRHAFSTSYEAYLVFKQSDKATPVYLGDVVFNYDVKLKFPDSNDFSVRPKAFAIKIGDRVIADSLSLNRTLYTCKLDTAGETTFTLWCDGSNSEFLPDKLTKDFTLNIERRDPPASDFKFTLPAELKFDGSEKEVTVEPADGIVGMGTVTVHYYSDGELMESAPVNAGDYTFTIDVSDDGDNYKAASGLTDSTWAFTIEKADAPKVTAKNAYYTYAESGEKTIDVDKLPENAGTVGNPRYTSTGKAVKEFSVSYSDGVITFTLADNIAINDRGVILIELPSQNYTDMKITVNVGITDKQERMAPELMDFDLVFTSKGSDITANIVTELTEVEFSFDGVNWSDVNTAPVGHEQNVTAFIRFIETEKYKLSPASSRSGDTGHGTLVHHARIEPDCTKTGNIEYWECEVCSKYFSDEDGTAEITLESTILAITNHTEAPAVMENVKPATCTEDGSYDEVIYCSVCKTKLSTEPKTIPATGHKWSEKYESDKTGHWHKCEACSEINDFENHVSDGPATTRKAEICIVCGYEIAPKKSSGGSGGSGGSSGGPKDTTVENKPALNGTHKSWTEIAAELGRQNGGSAVITLNGETTVPADVIKAIMNSKIKVEFVIDSVKSWIVDGGKITAVNAADLSVIPGNADKTALRGINGADLKINGTGVPSDMKLKFRKEYAGQFANVYGFADGKLTFQGCFRVGTDGAVVISGADAAGEYIVMVCEYSDLPGDMTNDGVLNALDASAVLKSIVGAADGANQLMADFNGDGTVNALDASAILKYIVSPAA